MLFSFDSGGQQGQQEQTADKVGGRGQSELRDYFLSICFAERSCYLKTQQDYKGYFSR